MVVSEGLYAPFTLSGTVVVDDVLASCYASMSSPLAAAVSAQTLAHLGLGPLRAAYHLGLGGMLLEVPRGKEMPTCIELSVEYFRSYLTL